MGGLSPLPAILALGLIGLANQLSLKDAILSMVSGLMVVLAYAWLAAFRIELPQDAITFRSLLKDRQTIRRDGIERVELRKVAGQISSYTGCGLKLFIIPREGTGYRPLTINAKVFSPAAIRAVLALLLNAKCSMRKNSFLAMPILRAFE